MPNLNFRVHIPRNQFSKSLKKTCTKWQFELHKKGRNEPSSPDRGKLIQKIMSAIISCKKPTVLLMTSHLSPAVENYNL